MFKQEDAAELEQVIAKTLKITNSQDYLKENIEVNILSHSAEVLTERAKRIEVPASITAVEFYRKWDITIKTELLE